MRDLYVEGRLDLAMGSAGESAGLVGSVQSVGEIVEETVAGFWDELDRLAALARRRPPTP